MTCPDSMQTNWHEPIVPPPCRVVLHMLVAHERLCERHMWASGGEGRVSLADKTGVEGQGLYWSPWCQLRPCCVGGGGCDKAFCVVLLGLSPNGVSYGGLSNQIYACLTKSITSLCSNLRERKREEVRDTEREREATYCGMAYQGTAVESILYFFILDTSMSHAKKKMRWYIFDLRSVDSYKQT